MSAGLEIRGLQPLLMLLDELARLEEIVDDPAGELLEWMRERLREQPSPVPSYHRTLELFDSWDIVFGSGDELGSVVSDSDHATWTQDAENQAWMHRGRGWHTVQSVAEEGGDRAEDIFEAWLQQFLDRVP